jgi:hypothetical protein
VSRPSAALRCKRTGGATGQAGAHKGSYHHQHGSKDGRKRQDKGRSADRRAQGSPAANAASQLRVFFSTGEPSDQRTDDHEQDTPDPEEQVEVGLNRAG